MKMNCQKNLVFQAKTYFVTTYDIVHDMAHILDCDFEQPRNFLVITF